MWRVFFSSFQEATWLAATHDVWEVDHENDFVVAAISPSQAEVLAAAGWRMERLPPPAEAGAVNPVSSEDAGGGIPLYPCYRTIEETYTDLERLAHKHPKLASWLDIGDSWEKDTGVGGSDIHALVLTNFEKTSPKFRLLVMGAVHARELTTAETVSRFAEHLISAYGPDPDVTWLLDYGEIHLIPIVNPDGRKRAEQLQFWRKNTDYANGCYGPGAPANLYGIDLNRNSGFKWSLCESEFCSSADPCDITYRGPAPDSEPETVAYQQYVRSLFPDQRGPDDKDAAPSDVSGLILSLHSYGELVLFPWGWTQAPAPNHGALQELGAKLGSLLDYTVCQAGAPNCLYQTDGTVEDWAYGELGIPAYTFELGTEFFQSCAVYGSEILDQTLLALTYAAKAAHRPYLAPAGPDIVDLNIQNARVIPGTDVTMAATATGSSKSNASSMQTAVAARYSVDMPSWTSGAKVFAMDAQQPPLQSPTKQFTAIIDTEGWAPGRYMILAEARNAQGQWGPPTAAYLDIVTKVASFSVHTPVSTVELRSGNSFTHTITITNTGVISDSYAADAVANRWDTVVRTDSDRPVDPGSATHIDVVVTVPPRIRPNSVDSAVVDIYSRADPTLRSSVRIRTRAGGFTVHLPAILR